MISSEVVIKNAGKISPTTKELMSFATLRHRCYAAHQDLMLQKKAIRKELELDKKFSAEYKKELLQKRLHEVDEQAKNQRNDLTKAVNTVIQNRRDALKQYFTEIPDDKTVKLLQLMQMRKAGTISEDELQLVIEQCGTSFQALKICESIAKDNGYTFVNPLNTGNLAAGIDRVEKELSHALDCLGQEMPDQDARYVLWYKDTTADDEYAELDAGLETTVSNPKTVLQRLQEKQTEAIENGDENLFNRTAQFIIDHEDALNATKTDADRQREYSRLEQAAIDKGIIE